MVPLDPVEVGVLGLAVYRLTRLVTEDAILDAPRDAVADWLQRHRLGKVAEAIDCHWCAGVWVSAAAYAGWVTAAGCWGETHAVAHGLTVAAVAGVQGLLGSWEGGQ